MLPFFAISHGVSWAFWLPAAILTPDSGVWASWTRWLVYLGGLGPPLAGIVATHRLGGRRGLVDLGRRIVDLRRIPGRWLLACLLVPPAAMLVGWGLGRLIDPAGSAVDTSGLASVAADPVSIAPLAGFLIVFGPLPEEIGWRGYALDALQQRSTAFGASLVLGGAWAAWHVPLFFVPGYYGDAVPDPVVFAVAILGNSVLFTWIHNNTRRSVLAAILFHFQINFVGTLVEGSLPVEWLRALATASLVVVVIRLYGAATLRREAKAEAD